MMDVAQIKNTTVLKVFFYLFIINVFCTENHLQINLVIICLDTLFDYVL